MNELMETINSEVRRIRYGTLQICLTLHDGQIRCVNLTSSKKILITPNQAKDDMNGRYRKN